MCVAIPARIESIENQMGVVDAGGVKRSVSLLLLEDAKVGDYIIVHAGFGIHTIDEKHAKESLELLREMAQYQDDPDDESPLGS